ncbi:MAG: quinolinate synthase NadA [Bdellovibrionales bacterium]|jgi:quinolinate synthase
MTDDDLVALYKRLDKVVAQDAWGGMAEDIMAIRALKKEKNAVILAHNYMTPEVYFGVADVTGDSLALAREAAKMQADVIVCAGVHFMAETAKLMNPSRIVLSPDLQAGCSLADSITPEDVRTLREKYPDLPIITYVNTSAAVKAECHICCTSGNAKKVVESLGVPEVIMVPDEYLAQNVARQTSVKIIPWHGHCEVHEQYAPQEVAAIRRENPDITIIAHPECPPDVVAQADFSGSTVNMTDWVAAHHPRQVMLLTERSMSDNAAVDHPDIDFVRPRLPCPYMKLITLAAIRRSLETMTYPIEIEEDVAAPARRAVERMVAVK